MNAYPGQGPTPPTSLAILPSELSEVPIGEETRMLHASTSEGILSTVMVLTIGVVGVRIYIRAVMLRHWGHDDSLVVLALLTSLATTIGLIAQAEWGNSYGMIFASPRALQAGFTAIVSYVFANSFVKLSILTFCLTTFGKSSKFVRNGLLGLIGFISFRCLFAFITIMAGCQPISLNWSTLADRSKCFNPPVIGALNAIFSLLEDGAVLFIPLYLVNRIQANRNSKRFLMGILGLGVFALLAGLARAIALLAFLVNIRNPSTEVILVIVTAIEINTAIIAASLPALSPLLKVLIRHFLSAASHSSSSSHLQPEKMPVKTSTTTTTNTIHTNNSSLTITNSTTNMQDTLLSVTNYPNYPSTPVRRKSIANIFSNHTKRMSTSSALSVGESFPLYGIKIDQSYSVETSPNPYTLGLGPMGKKPVPNGYSAHTEGRMSIIEAGGSDTSSLAPTVTVGKSPLSRLKDLAGGSSSGSSSSTTLA